MRQIPKKPKVPVYHRQRLLLYFLDAAKPAVSRLDLQKLLFLYCKETDKPQYAFVPYKYGCYSFLCTDDLDLLDKRGWIESDGNRLSLAVDDLKEHPWAAVNGMCEAINKWLHKNRLRGDELVLETYRRYPYYALHSQMKDRLLDPTEQKAVRESIEPVKDDRPVVFTLGYEGIHFETYLNKLIRNQVKALCDLRKNANSRKFGFSGRTFAQILPKFGIEYVHIRALGIESEKRRNLNSQKDYEALLYEYRKELPHKKEGLRLLKHMIKSKRRVALTCFEAEPLRCHRHCVGELMASQYGHRIKHL